MLSVNISGTAIITVKNVDFRCTIHKILKSEAINLLQNFVLEDRGYLWHKQPRDKSRKWKKHQSIEYSQLCDVSFLIRRKYYCTFVSLKTSSAKVDKILGGK